MFAVEDTSPRRPTKCSLGWLKISPWHGGLKTQDDMAEKRRRTCLQNEIE